MNNYTFFNTIPILIVVAYALGIWRVARMRGVRRIVVALLLAVPPALIIWRATTPTDVECLAHISFDGNQAAVLSQYQNFVEGYAVHLAYRGTDDSDWSMYYLDHDAIVKWRGVSVTNTPTGVVVSRRGGEPIEFIRGVRGFCDPDDDSGRKIDGWFSGSSVSSVLDKIEERGRAKK